MPKKTITVGVYAAIPGSSDCSGGIPQSVVSK